MKVTQYFTTTGNDFLPDAEFVRRPVFEAQKLSGVKTIKRQDLVTDDFIGFGVAITGSSCYNLAQMEKEERTNLLKRIYGKDGLGFNIARLSIGSSDYSAQVYSYDDTEGDVSLKCFSLQKDEEYIIPIIKEILQINPDLYLYASPWSPPGWMKTSGSMGGGYMRKEFIDCYAEYIVRFIQGYANYGIKICALTPQNEIETAQGGTMPACLWGRDEEASFVVALRKKLRQNNLDVKIWILDHNFSYHERVANALQKYEGVEDSCDGIAFHYYGGFIEDTLLLQQSYPKLSMHFTEGGPRLYDNYSTDFCKWGIMISKVLNFGYKSFTGWNLMLDEFGGPNVGPFFCGGLITRNSRSGELIYSGQYKAFTHTAHFMQAGALVYKIENEDLKICMSDFPPEGKIPLQVACVENPDGTICYFMTNANATKVQVQILEGDRNYYVEVLPNTISTVVFEP